jgi:hypothetical protein
LTAEQIAKKGLQESEINWEGATEPPLPAASREQVEAAKKVADQIAGVIDQMNRNKRAKADIAGWRRDIQVRTTGGEFAILINDGDIRVSQQKLSSPDLVMVLHDANVLLAGLSYRGALTDSVIGGKIWLSKNGEFTTIFKLDRMARSLARSEKTASED